MNLDAYYRGLAGSQLQEFGDGLLVLSREAETAGAHDAALHLADLSTQLLDLALEVGGRQARREPETH